MTVTTSDHGADRAWRAALSELRRASGAAVGFGGPVERDALRLTHVDGARTAALHGLGVAHGRGLGGRVWRERAPYGVDDYGTAADISHHYDLPVRVEGLRTVVAAPVVVGAGVRAVVYAGVREPVPYGDRLLDAVMHTARRLGRDLAIEAEVDRRVAAETDRLQQREAAAAERLRRADAGLRELRAGITDPELRAMVTRVLEDVAPCGEGAAELTPREVDVLAVVATGASYATVAERLGLRPQTVKSYMRDVMARLGVHSRHEAVVAARRHGLLA